MSRWDARCFAIVYEKGGKRSTRTSQRDATLAKLNAEAQLLNAPCCLSSQTSALNSTFPSTILRLAITSLWNDTREH